MKRLLGRSKPKDNDVSDEDLNKFKSLLGKILAAAKDKKDDVDSASSFSDHIKVAGKPAGLAALAALEPFVSSEDPTEVYLCIGLLDFCVSRNEACLLPLLLDQVWVDRLEAVARKFGGQPVCRRIVGVSVKWDQVATFAGMTSFPSPLCELSRRLQEDFPDLDSTPISQMVQFKGKCGVCGVKLLFPPNSTKAKCGRCNAVVKLPKEFLTSADPQKATRKGVEAILGLKHENDQLREQVEKQKDLEQELEKLRLENARLKVAKDEQEEAMLCSICLDTPKDAALVPCGHSFCHTCSQKLQETKKTCPICRKKIKQVNVLYI
eukprot:c17958_g1_i1.p2 GENE.c17958_g1_i1~~c17958_g1_i1.p2  ORF type:complete len:322 (+),score=57.22 c17958_g1_i1:35-1000(+)